MRDEIISGIRWNDPEIGVAWPVAVVPLWQVEQLVSVAAWVYLPVPVQLVKLVLAWQDTQSFRLMVPRKRSQ